VCCMTQDMCLHWLDELSLYTCGHINAARPCMGRHKKHHRHQGIAPSLPSMPQSAVGSVGVARTLPSAATFHSGSSLVAVIPRPRSSCKSAKTHVKTLVSLVSTGPGQSSPTPGGICSLPHNDSAETHAMLTVSCAGRSQIKWAVRMAEAPLHTHHPACCACENSTQASLRQ
jgi:hypothetical protein